ncbi:MFS transporter [Streptomyces sp. NPDC052040]|uniref:MFS transporter n=1 Tax=Streptomyces sp. NPDC052040 TaxID=3365682 RepID=UPI0037D27F20
MKSTGTDDISQHPQSRSLRPLTGVLSALAVALTSSRSSAVALPWYVLTLTGSAAQTGLVSFCQLLPYVAGKLLLGSVVDHVGARRASWVADVVSASALCTVPLLHWADGLSFPVLLVLVTIIGAARAPGDLAKETMVPEAAELARVPLSRATGFSGTIQQGAAIIGLTGGGWLVAAGGPQAALGINGLLFLVGSLIVAFMIPRPANDVGKSSPDVQSPGPAWWRTYLASMAEGFRFLRGDHLLMTAIALLALLGLLDTAFSTVLLPVWAEGHGRGAQLVGSLGGILAVAAIVGSAVAAAFAHRLPRRAVFLGALLIAGGPRFLILGLDVPVSWVFVVIAISGFAEGLLNPVLGAAVLQRIPRDMLGRVGGIADAMAYAGIPFGGMLAGVLVGAFGGPAVLLAGSALYFAVVLVNMMFRAWRELDTGKHVDERVQATAESRPRESDTAWEQ